MMRKITKIELEVDFIGGEVPLTMGEETALSAFFKERKLILSSPEIKNVARKTKQKSTSK